MRTKCRRVAEDTRFVIYSDVRRGVRRSTRVLVSPATGGLRVTPRGSGFRLLGKVSAVSFCTNSECEAASSSGAVGYGTKNGPW
jgi:hypothetical protein